MVIARAKPPITARQTTGLIWDTPVRQYRIPSTPYVRGSMRITGPIHRGSELMGKSAPDSPNIGKGAGTGVKPPDGSGGQKNLQGSG